jgi:putative membrane protein
VAFIGHFYVLVLFLLFWAVIIVAGVWLVLWAIRVSPRRLRSNGALTILNERFARGEIDQAEYEKRKNTILGR